MANKLHPKIKELQRRAAAVSYSSVAVNEKGELQQTDLDKRIVKGYAFIWGSRNDRGEVFHKGSFTKTIQERGPKSSSRMPTKFLAYHNQTKPLALFDVLQEDETGLYFETKPLDDVTYAGDILVSLRSGTLNNFSGGFNPVWEKSEYIAEMDAVWHKEVMLHEISPVSLASDEMTHQVRSMFSDEELDDFNEELNSFVESIPRQYRLHARSLFARQKSLYLIEPPKQADALDETKPIKKRAIDYNFLTKKLKEQNEKKFF